MAAQSPRDMREWMRSIERRLGETGRGSASTAAGIIKTVTAVQDTTSKVAAAPVEISWQITPYLDTDKRSRFRLLLDFPDVVRASDATSIVTARYELWAQDETPPLLNQLTQAIPGLADPGLTMPGLSFPVQTTPTYGPMNLIGSSADSSFNMPGFIPASVWRFRIRALAEGSTAPGDWSEEIVITMLTDDGPPPQTTAPTLRIERGTITVLWDGQSVQGSLPADFSYAVLAGGKTSSPTTELYRFGRDGGFFVVADLPYYEVQFYRLQAFDQMGNASPWSAQATGYTEPLVDKDVILSTIDGAKTLLKNVDASVSVLAHTVVTENLLVTEDMTAAIANFLTVNADMVNANSIWADEIWVGLADATIVRADMFTGKEFDGGTFTGALFQTDTEAFLGVKIGDTGIGAWAPDGTQTFTLDSGTGNMTAIGTFQTAASGRRVKVWDHGYGDVNQIASIDMSPDGSLQHGAVYSEIRSDGIYYTQLRHFTDDSNTSAILEFSSAGDIQFGGNNKMTISNVSDTQIASQTSMIITGGNGQLQLTKSSGTTLFSGQNIALYSGGNASLTLYADNSTQAFLNGQGLLIGGSLSVAGAKNFRIPHPSQSGLDLLHASTESPVSGVEYWGTGTVADTGECTVTLPDYFEALVKPDGRTVLVTAQGEAVTWTDITTGSFTVTGTAGTVFSWLVKGERIGADFDVEQPAMVSAAIATIPVNADPGSPGIVTEAAALNSGTTTQTTEGA